MKSIDFRVFPDGSTDVADGGPVDTPMRDLALGLLAENIIRVEFIWTGRLIPIAVCIERTRRFGNIVARVHGTDCKTLPLGLTLRELDVVTLVVAGFTNAQIASVLNIGLRTTTTHIDHIMRKFDAANRATVAAIALDRGLISLPLPVAVDKIDQLAVGRMLRSAGVRRPPSPASTGGHRAETPIVIGALIPSMGRGRADAAGILNGALQAIAEINGRGGIHGRKLAMEVADVDVDDASTARREVSGLLEAGPSAITSGYLAGQSDAMHAAAASGIPFLHSSASSSIGMTVSADLPRFRNTFQFSPNDQDYAPAYVAFLNTLRESALWHPTRNRAAIVIQSRWDKIDLGIRAAQTEAAAAGWELIVIEAADRRDPRSAWEEAARVVRRTDVAAVMIGSYFPADHVQFIREHLAAPNETLIYSAYAPSVSNFGAGSGLDLEGLVWSTTTGTYSDGLGTSFARRYFSRFGVPPGRSHAGIAYDKIHILAQAWRQLDDVGDFDEVGALLAETRYRGVNGAYAFDPKEHRTFSLGHTSTDPSLAQAHTIFQIQSGRNVLVSPAPYAEAPFRPPPWTIAGGLNHR